MKMLKDPKFNFLTQKITLSYMFLGVIALIAIFIIYDGIGNIVHIDESVYSPNKKLYLTNQVLTKIYDAEGDARSYYLFRNKDDLDLYIRKVGEIRKGIDTITVLSTLNKAQLNTLTKIKEILNQQQENIEQLIKIDSQNQKDELYKRALEEVYVRAYEIMPPSKVVKQNTTVRHDSIFKKNEKDNFFKKVKNLFSSSDDKQQKELSKVVVEQKITFDTILQTKPLPDSIIKLVQHTLEKLKQRDNYLKAKIVSNETQLLQSNRVLLNNLREMVSSLEAEEISNSTQSINKSKAIIHKTFNSVLWLGLITVFLFSIFIIIIYRAIHRNKQYNLALQVAQKNAQDLIKLKEQFLTNMSHEIRTPLSSIIGFSEQLNRTTLTDQQENYLGTIQKSSNHLLSLVNDILDLSKINAGKFVLENIRFNVVDLIHEVYQNFILAAQKKNVELTYTCDDVLKADIIGDPMRLRQVLINLVGNAVKFTESGTINICATCEENQSNQFIINIAISDTGVGIPTDKQKLIFEEFSQADNSVTRKFGGTGLGLSIASKIIKLQDGTISLASTPGSGSTFRIQLTFDKAIKSKNMVNTSTARTNNLLLKDRKILVVDDDETILLLINTIFSNNGLSCETANNGKKALNKISKKHFDLIFTDIHMPDMSGFELIKHIKNNYPDFNKAMHVIALTAQASDSNDYLNAGFTDYLSKPFKETDFLNKAIDILFPEQVDDHEKNRESLKNNGLPTDEAVSAPGDLYAYSLDGIIEFTGKDTGSLLKIIRSFVTNSLKTITEIKSLNPHTQAEEIANLSHKLIPLFKQFKMMEIAALLTRLERYKELNISAEEFMKLTIHATELSEKIVHRIEFEQIPKTEKVEST